MSIPKGLAAKARLIKDNGTKLYIEIRDECNFHNFYTTYTVQGKGRRRVIRPGFPRHRGFAESIEEAAEKIAATINQNAKRTGGSYVVDIKIWIYRKRLYHKRFNTPPDVLGLTRTYSRWNQRRFAANPTYRILKICTQTTTCSSVNSTRKCNRQLVEHLEGCFETKRFTWSEIQS